MFFTVFKSEEEAGEEAGWTVALRQRVEMRPMMGMVYVYILESESPVGKTYVGFTHDLKARFAAHNRGESPYTAKCRPWKLMAYVAVRTGAQAVALERYFKSGSGTAFWKKRLCWKAASVPEDPPEPKA
jgi:predicted GIY-YIG superfamily endonuclease